MKKLIEYGQFIFVKFIFYLLKLIIIIKSIQKVIVT